MRVDLSHRPRDDGAMDDGTSDFYKAFGHQLRSHRRRREMTQQKLADAAGVKRTSITNMEKGQQQVFLHQACAIAEILDVRPSDLLPVIDRNRSYFAQDAMQDLDKDVAEWVESVVREGS